LLLISGKSVAKGESAVKCLFSLIRHLALMNYRFSNSERSKTPYLDHHVQGLVRQEAYDGRTFYLW
jgi:hypothetical protein